LCSHLYLTGEISVFLAAKLAVAAAILSWAVHSDCLGLLGLLFETALTQMPEPHKQDRHTPSVNHSGTLLETDDEIRQALLAGIKTAEQDATAPPAVPYRPTGRPPMVLLTICDDGAADGEVVRIRSPRFIIGRIHGDLTVPFDKRMSSRHVEITHQRVGGVHRWVVTDLQSRHGLFVRVSRALLADQAEILVGNGRFRFDAPAFEQQETGENIQADPDSNHTHGLSEGAGVFRPPALTEVLGQGIGNRIVLVKPEYWIGSDPTCHICRPDDRFCEPRHAHVYSTPQGKWFAEHNKSQNGLWLRMPQVKVEKSIQFQIGEQRFRLRVQ
jgi:FHA domain